METEVLSDFHAMLKRNEELPIDYTGRVQDAPSKDG